MSLGARLGDILGRRKVLLAGLIIFSIASLLVGLAISQAMLIGMRAFQGVDGALLMDYYKDKMLARSIAYYCWSNSFGHVLEVCLPIQ